MKAGVVIQAGIREGRTFLQTSYAAQPFRIANITEDRKGPWLHLMLMCSSPGVLDGDEYTIRVMAGEKTRLRLHTQSFQRLFHMEEGRGGAMQSLEVHLAAGAWFSYLPHPVVPHRASVFQARNRVFLAAGSRLVWGEVLTCGRKANGEIFAFSRYHSITELYIDGRLVLRENILLEPAKTDMTGIGQMEGFTHQASLFLMGDEMTGADIQAAIRDYVGKEAGIQYGLSMGPGGVLVLRMLGHGAQQLHDCLQKAAGFASTDKTPFYAG